MSDKIKVMLSVPNTGWMHKLVHMTVLNIIMDTHKRFGDQIELVHTCPTWNPYEHNMHRIIADMLDQGFDFLISIDSDNPPKRNPIELVFNDLDVVGCPTPIWHNDKSKPCDRPFLWNVMDWDQDGEGFREHDAGNGGLHQVDAVGSGCIVIARRVLEAVKHPWMRRYDERGIVEMGGDFSFCLKAKEAGFTIWADYDYPCDHLKEIPMLEMIESWNGRQSASKG